MTLGRHEGPEHVQLLFLLSLGCPDASKMSNCCKNCGAGLQDLPKVSSLLWVQFDRSPRKWKCYEVRFTCVPATPKRLRLVAWRSEGCKSNVALLGDLSKMLGGQPERPANTGAAALRAPKNLQMLRDPWERFGRQPKRPANTGTAALGAPKTCKFCEICGRRLEDSPKDLQILALRP